MPRNLFDIAVDIDSNWKNVHYAAAPYLDAMHSLKSIDDNYTCESGKSVVIYFLSNATSWRGEDARRIKTELRDLLST